VNLKTKIRVGLLTAFTIIVILGILGGYFLDRTANNSIQLLQTNYRTLSYTREMSLALSDILNITAVREVSSNYRRISLRRALDRFELYLELQANNTTEQGEKDLTDALREDFENFKAAVYDFDQEQDSPIQLMMQNLNIQELLKQVYQLNEDHIQQKTKAAYDLASQVTLVLIILGFFFFVFAVIAMFYFPDYITNPIHQLTLSIQGIANRNYSQRLPVNSNDEFGEVAAAFNEMAAKLDEFESMNVSQLVAEKQRVETIVGKMNEAIIGVDQQNRVLFANERALGLIGEKEENLVGRSAEAIAQENPAFAQIAEEIWQVGETENQTVTNFLLERDGKTQYFEKDILRVAGGTNQEGDGFVVILKDVTGLKEQDLAKTNFMATLSHELKTPISAIDMSLGLLQDERIGTLNHDQEELAETIRQNSNRLLKMVNEILSVSKIETGIMELEYAEVLPREVVERALITTHSFIREKRLELHADIESDLPLIEVDLQQTTGVLINFLTNAVRYSPEGGNLWVQVVRESGNVRFSVKDEGPGIPVEERQAVFNRYQRRKDDQTQGTGLGLAISKEFIEKQGGRIWVESEEGKGSTFYFSIPIDHGDL
jgi:PAS domain S-box-containing protein